MPADSTPFQHLGWDHVQGNQASDWMTDLLETNQLEASFLIELCVQISNIYFYTWSSPTTQQASKQVHNRNWLHFYSSAVHWSLAAYFSYTIGMISCNSNILMSSEIKSQRSATYSDAACPIFDIYWRNHNPNTQSGKNLIGI